MAAEDLFCRSDVDKGEVSPDADLRLRSDANKEAGGGGGSPAVVVTIPATFMAGF